MSNRVIIPTFSIGCLNSLDCQELCFDVNNVVKIEGVIPSLVVPNLAFIDNDTIMTINGVRFTFAATGDADCNVIEIGADVTQRANNIITALTQNFELADTLAGSFLFPDLTLLSVACDSPITVEFQQLNAIPESATFTESGIPLELLEDYHIKATFTSPNCDPIENVRFPLETSISEDKCTVNSAVACKNIIGLIKDCVYTPTPLCGQNILGIERPEMSAMFSIKYAEYYGTPINPYNSRFINNAFTLYNGYLPTGKDTLDDYCAQSSPLALSVRSKEDTYCLGQCNSVYLYLEESISVTGVITMYDKDNNIIFQTGSYPIWSEPSYTGILEAQTGLCELFQVINPPIQIEDVKRYEIVYTSLDNAGAKTFQTICYNVECKDCFEEFVFLSSLGTWESIAGMCFNNAQLNVAREFIEICEPCNPSTATRGRQQTQGEVFESFIARIDSEKYTKQFLDEFFCSTDVYWRFNGQLYWIEPTDTTYITLQNDRQPLIPFNYRISAKKQLFQC